MRLLFAVPAAVQTHTAQPAALQSPSRLLLIDKDPMLIKSLQDTLEPTVT